MLLLVFPFLRLTPPCIPPVGRFFSPRIIEMIQFKSIGEANTLKRLILTSTGVVLVLDIERSNIVRQQHDFITKEVVFVLVFQSTVGYTMQEVDNIATSANTGVNDLHVWLFDRHTEFTL